VKVLPLCEKEFEVLKAFYLEDYKTLNSFSAWTGMELGYAIRLLQKQGLLTGVYKEVVFFIHHFLPNEQDWDKEFPDLVKITEQGVNYLVSGRGFDPSIIIEKPEHK
jgi:hypothetical protein